jgi:membrane protease YdiL (CAAX protease family)
MSQPGSRPRPPLGDGAALATAVVLFLVGVALMFGGAAQVAQTGVGLRAQVAVGTLLFALPVALFLAAQPPARPLYLGAHTVGHRQALVSVLLGGALWVASIGIVELQALVRPPAPEEIELFRRLHAALAPRGLADAVASLVVIAFLPALCEELVMRGALLASLLPVAASWFGGRAGPVVSLLVTGAAFAVIHDPVRLVFAFLLGVALGALRLRTRSIGPPILAHATLNALTFAIAPLVDDPAKPYEPQPVLGLACLVAGCAVAWPLFQALRAGTAGRTRA